MERGKSIYQVANSSDGHGTFYFTKCCNNRMYSVKGIYAYHGCLCPKCFSQNNKLITLYLAGTLETNKILNNGECIFKEE